MVIPLLTTSFWNVLPFFTTRNVIHHLLMVDFTIFLMHEMFFLSLPKYVLSLLNFLKLVICTFLKKLAYFA